MQIVAAPGANGMENKPEISDNEDDDRHNGVLREGCRRRQPPQRFYPSNSRRRREIFSKLKSRQPAKCGQMGCICSRAHIRNKIILEFEYTRTRSQRFAASLHERGEGEMMIRRRKFGSLRPGTLHQGLTVCTTDDKNCLSLASCGVVQLASTAMSSKTLRVMYQGVVRVTGRNND